MYPQFKREQAIVITDENITDMTIVFHRDISVKMIFWALEYNMHISFKWHFALCGISVTWNSPITPQTIHFPSI